MLFAIIAAAAIAQAEPAWHKVKFNNQDLTVWGVREADGKILWHPNEQPDYKPAPPRYQVNGVKADKLSRDFVKVRASDAETLAQAIKQVDEARRPNCPEPSKPADEPEAKPLGPLKQAENGLVEILTFVASGVLCLGALALIVYVIFSLSAPTGEQSS
jgi:hypothetical protein